MSDLREYISISYSNEEISMLKKLFHLFKNENIPYIILRGYNYLPEHNISAGSNDIDILISSAYYNKALDMFTNLGFSKDKSNFNDEFQLLSLNNLKYLKSPMKVFYYIKKKISKNTSEINNAFNILDSISASYSSFVYGNIKIDVWKNIGHKSLEDNNYTRIDPNMESEIIKSRILFNNLFFVASAPYELAHLINRVILDKEGKLTPYYNKQIKILINEVKKNPTFREIFKNNLSRTYFKAGDLVLEKTFQNQLSTLREELLSFEDY